MHLGTNNQSLSYKMALNRPGENWYEGDLNVMQVDHEPPVCNNCENGYHNFRFIRWAIYSRDKEVLIPLYVALVRTLF